jgi:hypothetical protein
MRGALSELLTSSEYVRGVRHGPRREKEVAGYRVPFRTPSPERVEVVSAPAISCLVVVREIVLGDRAGYRLHSISIRNGSSHYRTSLQLHHHFCQRSIRIRFFDRPVTEGLLPRGFGKNYSTWLFLLKHEWLLKSLAVPAKVPER